MKKLIVIFIILVGTVFAINEYVARGIYSQNGEFLDGENTDLKHPLGTLTKLMTALVVYDKDEEGKISFETQVRVLTSDLIVDGAKMSLKKDEMISVNDLLIGMILGDQNAAAMMLSRAVAGNENDFVKLMNEKAKKIGMKNTIFYTSTGITSDFSKKKLDIGTIEDINKLIIQIRKNEKYSKLLQEKSQKIRENTLSVGNVNRFSLENPNILPIKQGFFEGIGYNVAFSYKKDKNLYNVIFLGSMNEELKNQQVEEEVSTLNNDFQTAILVSRGEFMVEAPLYEGKTKTISLYAAKDISLEIKSDWVLDKTILLPKKIKAPIKKGDKIGTYIVRHNGKEIGRIDLVAIEAHEKSNILDEIRKNFTR